MKTLVGAMILALSTCAAMPQGALRPPLKTGDRAPQFTLPNGDGKLVKLSDYTARGPLVLVFYRGFW